MSRSGRPRKADARRRKKRRDLDADAVERIVPPTEELKAHRMAIAGRTDISHDCPLDVLMAREIITDTQQKAGWMFAGCRWRAFGFPSDGVEAIWTAVVSGRFDGDSRPQFEDDEQTRRIERARAQYEGSLEAMRRAGLGRIDMDEVVGASVFLRMPSWFWRARNGHPRAGDERRRAGLVSGLEALTGYFRLADRREEKAA